MSQPRRQRKLFFKAPLHIRQKMIRAKLSNELRQQYGIKRFSIRKGDVVRILRGDFKGHEGKVVKVDLKRIRIHIEGVTITKADGSSILRPIHPSKVEIVKLDLSDKYRRFILDRIKGIGEK
ncbi:MAG: 50S ribosomal protein L24 [Candidatus Methanomethylicia archaeon]